MQAQVYADKAEHGVDKSEGPDHVGLGHPPRRPDGSPEQGSIGSLYAHNEYCIWRAGGPVTAAA